jgi:hypothetical protein
MVVPPYAFTFIAIPFTLCAIDRVMRDQNGYVACDRMWPLVRPTDCVTALWPRH